MDDHRAALHEYLLVEFVLTLLYSGVTKGTLGGRSPEALGRLDPLLPLLVRALHCRHSASVSLALRTLAALVALPLPTLRTAAPAAGKAVAALLKRAPSLAHPVAQDSFRLLAGMLRECATYKPSTGSIRFLLKWGFGELEASADRTTAFGLLRAILARRIVVPEVYDVMERVQARRAPPLPRCSSGGLLLRTASSSPLPLAAAPGAAACSSSAPAPLTAHIQHHIAPPLPPSQPENRS